MITATITARNTSQLAAIRNATDEINRRLSADDAFTITTVERTETLSIRPFSLAGCPASVGTFIDVTITSNLPRELDTDTMRDVRHYEAKLISIINRECGATHFSPIDVIQVTLGTIEANGDTTVKEQWVTQMFDGSPDSEMDLSAIMDTDAYGETDYACELFDQARREITGLGERNTDLVDLDCANQLIRFVVERATLRNADR